MTDETVDLDNRLRAENERLRLRLKGYEDAMRVNWMTADADLLYRTLSQASIAVGAFQRSDEGSIQPCGERLVDRAKSLRAELAEARKDTKRLDWLEGAVPSGRLRQAADGITIWSGTVRSLLDRLAGMDRQ